MPLPVVTPPSDDSYYRLKDGATVLVTLEGSFREVDPLPRRNLTPVRTPGGSTLYYRGDGRPLPGLKVLEGLVIAADEWTLGTRLAAIRSALATADTLERVTPGGTTTWALESEPVPGYLTDAPATMPGKAFQRRVTLFLLATQLSSEPAASIPTVTLPDPVTGTPGSVTYPDASSESPPSVTIPVHDLVPGSTCSDPNGTWYATGDTTYSPPAEDNNVRNGSLVGHDGFLYHAGGNPSPNPVGWFYKIDPATGAITYLTGMPTARWNAGAAVLDGKIYVVGGQTLGTGGHTTSVEAYDITAGTWATRASLPAARAYLRVEALDGFLYAFGGEDSSEVPRGETYRYDPTANTWTTIGSLDVARDYLTSAVFDGRVLAIGGLTTGGTPTASVEALDPTSGYWSTSFAPPLPVAASYLIAGAIGDDVFVAGGENDLNTNLRYTYRLRAATRQWDAMRVTPDTSATREPAWAYAVTLDLLHVLYQGGYSLAFKAPCVALDASL